MKRFTSILMATLLIIGAMTGCGGGGSTGSSSAAGSTAAAGATSGAAASGTKYLRVSLYSYPTDLEPTNGYYGWGLTRMGIGETLVKFDKDLNIQPWLATGWEQKNDTTMVFHIRDGVTFHNGNKMTAESVMKSIQRSMDKNTRAKDIANIKTMSVNGNDLTIETNGPYAALLPYLAEPVFTIVDTSVDDSDYANKPIATGPYKVEKFEQTVNIRVVKNEKYWDGTAGCDVIDFPYLVDADARAMALQAGDIDIGQAVVNKDLSSFANNADYIVQSRPSTKTIFSYINEKSKFMSNKQLREALAYAIDRELYAKNFIGGSAGKGPFSDVMGWGNETLKVPNYDPEKAKKMMDDAGIKDSDGDGFRELNGQKITINLIVAGTSDITIYKPMSEAMQAQLKNVGINMEIKNVETFNELDAGKEDYMDLMFKHINAGVNNDPQNFLNLYFYSGKANNFGNYSNKEYDAMIDQLFKTIDRKERIELTKKISQFLIDDTAAYFLGYPDYNNVSLKRVSNFVQYAVDWYLIDKDVTVTTERKLS